MAVVTTNALRPSAMQLAMQRAHDAGVCQLGLGLPDQALLPHQGLAEAAAVVFGATSALQYGPPEMRLKEHIVALMKTRGVDCTEDDVVLTSGAQQGLSLLTRLFSPFGRRALVGETVYPAFRQAAEQAMLAVVPIRVDARTGLDLEDLRRELGRNAQSALLYAMSAGHNPSGTTMSAATRQGIVDAAVRHRLPVIEDDVYGCLQYDERREPPLRALESDWIFYVGSFSKLLGPALRVGWIVAPVRWRRELSALKEASDLDVATAAQRIVCRFLDRSSLAEHIAAVRAAYRARRDALCAALSTHLGSIARWQVPRAGFFVWLETTPAIDTNAWLARALASGVAFVPGTFFSVTDDGRHRHCLRLSFSCCGLSLMEQAVQLLAVTGDAVSRPAEGQ